MRFYVGVTDNDWFEFLAAAPREEVNFWSPGGNTNFQALSPNEVFLFKLHSPRNFIVGGGFFVSHIKLPLSLAWGAFGQNNGALDEATVLQRVKKYRRTEEPDPVIGCNILATPFFFPCQDWIPAPQSFQLNTVRGKGYSTDTADGSALWEQVQARLQRALLLSENPSAQPALVAEGSRYGAPYLTQPRLGQGAFRVLVTDAYERRCALTGERTLPVLAAAHIRPYAQAGPHEIRNGLLMRADLHILFDQGYLTVQPDLTIKVSSRIHTQYSNGREYYALQDRPLAVLPASAVDRPSVEFLNWHNEAVFRP